MCYTQNDKQNASKPVGSSAATSASAKDDARKHQMSELSTDGGGGDWLDASAHTVELSDEAADTDEERHLSGKRASLVMQEHMDERVRSPLTAALLQQQVVSASASGAPATLLEAREVQLVNEQQERLPRSELATTQAAVQTDPLPEQLPPDASLLPTPTPHDSLSASALHLHTVDLSHSELGNTLNETEFEVCQFASALFSTKSELITEDATYGHCSSIPKFSSTVQCLLEVVDLFLYVSR